jgi:hypothetical protein
MPIPASELPMSDAMTSKQMCTAYHEAGHVVAAVQLGIPVIGATIDPRRPRFTRDGFRPSRNLAIEHLCIICVPTRMANDRLGGCTATGGTVDDPRAVIHRAQIARPGSLGEPSWALWVAEWRTNSRERYDVTPQRDSYRYGSQEPSPQVRNSGMCVGGAACHDQSHGR